VEATNGRVLDKVDRQDTNVIPMIQEKKVCGPLEGGVQKGTGYTGYMHLSAYIPTLCVMLQPTNE